MTEEPGAPSVEVECGGTDWDAAYRRLTPRVRSLLAARARAGAELDDLVQETFARAFRSRHRFDESRPLWPWLARIAECVAADDARRIAPATSSTPRELLERIADPGPSMEEQVVGDAEADAVAAALAALTPRERHLVTVAAVDADMPQRELADRELMSYPSFVSALMRARRRLRLVYLAAAEDLGVLGAVPLAAAWGRRLRRAAHLAASPVATVTVAAPLIAAGILLVRAGPSVGAAQPAIAVPAPVDVAVTPAGPRAPGAAAASRGGLRPARAAPVAPGPGGGSASAPRPSPVTVAVEAAPTRGRVEGRVDHPGGELTKDGGWAVNCSGGVVAGALCAAAATLAVP